MMTLSTRFPVGRDVTIQELDEDPYPVFARLRADEPISWLPALNMWFVIGYDDVRTALMDSTRLTTASAQSTIFDTFGAQILTTEGTAHARYREATKSPFTPNFIRSRLDSAIRVAATTLIQGFEQYGHADLRAAFAGRLPIQVMLVLCGLPAAAEAQMRRWYDSFEAALANFAGDAIIRAKARQSITEFHALLDSAIESIGEVDEYSLLSHLVHAPRDGRLSNEEIKRNLSIIFFGGISTVEALLLNTLWALFGHPHALQRIRNDISLIPQTIEEAMRWLSPVQSATRHATEAFEWRGIQFAAHDTVNCMLGAANRDPTVFTEPDRFDLDRANSRRHLGFATGIHACLGSHLAKAEVRIGLEALFGKLDQMRLDRSLTEPPTGYEFRQPRKLTVRWDPSRG
jgi:cytochrome P450